MFKIDLEEVRKFHINGRIHVWIDKRDREEQKMSIPQVAHLLGMFGHSWLSVFFIQFFFDCLGLTLPLPSFTKYVPSDCFRFLFARLCAYVSREIVWCSPFITLNSNVHSHTHNPNRARHEREKEKRDKKRREENVCLLSLVHLFCWTSSNSLEC